jgi:hypothetical protein
MYFDTEKKWIILEVLSVLIDRKNKLYPVSKSASTYVNKSLEPSYLGHLGSN